jgi:Protein of unknown function (DUF2491)
MFKSLSRLFSGAPHGEAPAVPEIMNLTIGRTAELDPLLPRLVGEDAVFRLPATTLAFVAQGLVRLEDGMHLHRLYTEDHVFLQLLTAARDGSDGIRDVTLFAPLESFYPSGEADLGAWRERLRQTSFQLADGTRFERFWFDNSDRPEDPVEIMESVYEDRRGTAFRRIHQTSMLFHRTLASGMRELLLCSIERPDGTAPTVELMAGIPLSPAQIRA